MKWFACSVYLQAPSALGFRFQLCSLADGLGAFLCHAGLVPVVFCTALSGPPCPLEEIEIRESETRGRECPLARPCQPIQRFVRHLSCTQMPTRSGNSSISGEALG